MSAWEPTPSSAPPLRDTGRNPNSLAETGPPTEGQGQHSAMRPTKVLGQALARPPTEVLGQAGPGPRNRNWCRLSRLPSAGTPPSLPRRRCCCHGKNNPSHDGGGATETPPRGTMYTEFFHNRKCFIAIRITGFNILQEFSNAINRGNTFGFCCVRQHIQNQH